MTTPTNNSDPHTGLASNVWHKGEGEPEQHGWTRNLFVSFLLLLLLAKLCHHPSPPVTRIQLTSGLRLSSHSPPRPSHLPGWAEQVPGCRAGHRGQIRADARGQVRDGGLKRAGDQVLEPSCLSKPRQPGEKPQSFKVLNIRNVHFRRRSSSNTWTSLQLSPCVARSIRIWHQSIHWSITNPCADLSIRSTNPKEAQMDHRGSDLCAKCQNKKCHQWEWLNISIAPVPSMWNQVPKISSHVMYHILYLINMTVCIHWMRCIYVLLSRNKAVQFLDLKWISSVSHWPNLMTQWPRATQWFQNTITPMTQYKVVLEGQWLTSRVVSGGLRWSHLHKLVRGVGRHYSPVITTLPVK